MDLPNAKMVHSTTLTPLEVTIKAMQYSQNPNVWIAALLHDVVEDTITSQEEIEFLFHREVRELVSWVSSMRMQGKKYKLGKGDSQGEKIRAEAPDEAKLIKLCDRWHNLETLGAMPPQKQEKKLRETEEIFIPMAEEIGNKALAEVLRELVVVRRADQEN